MRDGKERKLEMKENRRAEEIKRGLLNRDAMVYPTLRDLMDSGYLECQDEILANRREHVCRLTEKGREAYASAAEAWQRVR